MNSSFWLPNLHSDIVSANREEFEKSKFTKNKGEYYHCPYFYRKTAFCIGGQFPNQTLQHSIDTSNIQKTTVANNNCEKTYLGTVKMMEAKCEVIVIV